MRWEEGRLTWQLSSGLPLMLEIVPAVFVVGQIAVEVDMVAAKGLTEWRLPVM